MTIIVGPAGFVDSGSGTPSSVKTLGTDAWNRNKVYQDVSVFHGMFTFNVPVTKWKENLDSVEQSSFTNTTSVNGKLSLTSSGTLNERVKLDSFRNPRYEPNRGFLYSSSMFLPNIASSGERSFGAFTEESGVMFRVKSDGNLYAVRRSTLSGVSTDTEQLITVPNSIDLEKGNTFDIQFQWRGVGSYFWYINQNLVYTWNLLGTLDELSIFNPACPIAFECINQGDDVTLYCGCVDISIEGGGVDGKTYGSVGVNNDGGDVEVTGLNIPIVAARSITTINTLINTRDTRILRITGYGDQRCVLRVWKTRDFTAITENDQSWNGFGDGHLEYMILGLNADGTSTGITTPMSFDTSKATLQFTARVDIDQSVNYPALFEGLTDLYQTPGDLYVFTMHRENAGTANVGVTYEFAESI